MTLDEVKYWIWQRNHRWFEMGNITQDELGPPIAEGVLIAGCPMANVLLPTNAELAACQAEDELKFLWCIEYSILDFLIDSLPLNDIRTGAGMRDEKFSQLIGQLERKLARVKKKLGDTYGIGLPGIATRIMRLDFQEPEYP